MPEIIQRANHEVSRRDFSNSALKVLNRLHEAGFASYLVGGGVRDAMVGITPKDFDIATDASPEEVKALFKNSRIIGRRFRLVHVLFGREVIEVATFRADHASGTGGEVNQGGRILRDNVFGTIEEDAVRRDFTVNALYYNIADRTVVDFVGGLDDLENRVFRFIGDPLTRCEEDPVRVLRAARLAAKLDFDIHADSMDAMEKTAPLLVHMPPARLFEEVLKLFQGGYALQSFEKLRELDLVRYLFPTADERLKSDFGDDLEMLRAALKNTDVRISEGKPVVPSYLLAFMLWGDVFDEAIDSVARGVPASEAIWEASDKVLPTQLKVTSIPKRFSGPMREIWSMQPRLEQYTGGRAIGLMENRRFRAAYDFLCLRAQFDDELVDVAHWWTRVQELDESERLDFTESKDVVTKYWGRSRPANRSRGGKGQGKKTGSSKRRPSEKKSVNPGNADGAVNNGVISAATGKAGPNSQDTGGQDGTAPAKKRKRRPRRRGPKNADQKPGLNTGQNSAGSATGEAAKSSAQNAGSASRSGSNGDSDAASSNGPGSQSGKKKAR